MKTSKRGINLIKKHEGFRAKAYKCPAGVWTIGYGSTAGVFEGMVVTEAWATLKLGMDVVKAAQQLTGLNLDINQNQFDALVSFIYNVGFGAFSQSTLLKKIRAKAKREEIEFEFKRWNKGGGKLLPGLVNRRADEANLYFL